MNWEAEMTRDTMEKAIKKGIDQEIQEDWTKIENSSYFPIYNQIKEEIGRKYYFEWKNVKESEIKIWTRTRCGSKYNLGRFGSNSEGGEEVDERRKEDIWKGLEVQLRKGTIGREIMEFLKQEENKYSKDVPKEERN